MNEIPSNTERKGSLIQRGIDGVFSHPSRYKVLGKTERVKSLKDAQIIVIADTHSDKKVGRTIGAILRTQTSPGQTTLLIEGAPSGEELNLSAEPSLSKQLQHEFGALPEGWLGQYGRT